MPKVTDLLLARMLRANTLACCGLDPDIRKLPSQVLALTISDEEKVLRFLQRVIDVTAGHVCAYKAQKAFFDVFAGGHELLRAIIAYTHTYYPGIPVIVDCKVGDIGNTMAMYVENVLGLLEADGIIVNPYMGDDVFAPLAEHPDKAVVVLVKTSNPNGAIVQDVLLQNGQPFWRYVLDLLVNRWNSASNMVPVLSSTAGLDMVTLRPVIPDSMPILLAGVGAQGGSFADLRHLLNSAGVGPFINSSRGILYPSGEGDWGAAIERAAIELKLLINGERGVA